VQAIEYGILCNADDEKKLVKIVNAFLASKGYRTLRGFSPPKISVHSANSSARDKMVAGIRSIERLARDGAKGGV